MILQNDELKFYARQLGIPSFGLQGQAKLKRSKVLVIGAGGLGSSALFYLAAAGVGKIGICDGDSVDISNLHRQILFQWKDIGLPKSKIAALRLHDLNPWIETSIYTENFAEIIGAQRIIEEYDVILDCSDNFTTKFFLHDLCFSSFKPLVQASIYQFEGQLKVFRFSDKKGRAGACLRCLWPEVPPHNCIGTCEEAGVIGMVTGLFGSLQALETVKVILDIPSLENGEALLLDLMSFNMQRLRWSLSDNCPLSHEHKRLSK